MTHKEGAILTAHLDIVLTTSFDAFHKYAEELLGRPIHANELSTEEMKQTLRRKSENDFLQLMESQSN